MDMTAGLKVTCIQRFHCSIMIMKLLVVRALCLCNIDEMIMHEMMFGQSDVLQNSACYLFY